MFTWQFDRFPWLLQKRRKRNHQWTRTKETFVETSGVCYVLYEYINSNFILFIIWLKVLLAAYVAGGMCQWWKKERKKEICNVYCSCGCSLEPNKNVFCCMLVYEFPLRALWQRWWTLLAENTVYWIWRKHGACDPVHYCLYAPDLWPFFFTHFK